MARRKSTAIIAHIEKHDTIEDVEENGTTIRQRPQAGAFARFRLRVQAAQGKRSIGYLAHLKMMAAAQPFISGAISKTVNMPYECTVEDVRDTYVQAWNMGLKCVAIYRDGSKRSQPLNTKKTNEGGDKASAADESALASRIKDLEAEVAKLRAESGKPLRRRLSDTRQAVTHKFDIAGHEGYLTVGLFDDGQPGELFITMAKEGSTIGGLMDTIGTLTSMALQYGVPLEALVAEICAPAFRAERLHQKPGNPQRLLDHRLCVPLDGATVRPRLPRKRQCRAHPAGVVHARPAGGNEKKSNRPVPELLPIADDNEVVEVRTGNGNGHAATPGR